MTVKYNFNIVALPLEILANSCQQVIHGLFTVVNKGYDKPRFKYNVILSPRIKNADVFFTDLGFEENLQECVLFLAVLDCEKLMPGFHDIFAKLKIDYDDNNWFVPKVRKIDQTFNTASILGTIAFKPYPSTLKSFEITGFTSFERGVGKVLLSASTNYYQKELLAEQIVAKVIVEHELIEYYTSIHGFIEVERTLIKKGEQKSGLEDGIITSGDFHLATLVKNL